MSMSYHSQTDGQTKVMNRTLEDYLRAFNQDGQDRWDEMLTMAEFAMNNAMNASTDESPFFLNHGKHPMTPNIEEFDSRLTQVMLCPFVVLVSSEYWGHNIWLNRHSWYHSFLTS